MSYENLYIIISKQFSFISGLPTNLQPTTIEQPAIFHDSFNYSFDCRSNSKQGISVTMRFYRKTI